MYLPKNVLIINCDNKHVFSLTFNFSISDSHIVIKIIFFLLSDILFDFRLFVPIIYNRQSKRKVAPCISG